MCCEITRTNNITMSEKNCNKRSEKSAESNGGRLLMLTETNEFTYLKNRSKKNFFFKNANNLMFKYMRIFFTSFHSTRLCFEVCVWLVFPFFLVAVFLMDVRSRVDFVLATFTASKEKKEYCPVLTSIANCAVWP